jgi:hypothetical protein
MVFALLVVPLLGLACEKRDAAEPRIASAAGESGYATRFPTELGAVRGELQTVEADVNMLTGVFASYPNELDQPSWPHVEGMVNRADQAGRSESYVERARDGQAVRVFFTEQKDELNQRVGGAAQYAATQKGCKEADVYGAAAHGLQEGVNKGLEKRLRERNEAWQYVQDNQEALGKKNLPKLEKQADQIAYASYLSNILVVEAKVRIKAMVDESKEIKATLDRTLSESQAVVNDAGRADSDKKAAQKKLEAAEKAKQNLDSEVKQGEAALKDIDQRIKKVQEAYQKALDSLKSELKNRQKSA